MSRFYDAVDESLSLISARRLGLHFRLLATLRHYPVPRLFCVREAQVYKAASPTHTHTHPQDTRKHTHTQAGHAHPRKQRQLRQVAAVLWSSFFAFASLRFCCHFFCCPVFNLRPVQFALFVLSPAHNLLSLSSLLVLLAFAN